MFRGMNRWGAVLICATLFLSGCESTSDRCWRVYAADLLHTLHTDPASRLPSDTTPVPPPPKPSDMRWYNEHCWEGKPR